MWPIFLIAVGCALLLDGDSPPPRRERDEPETPPPPLSPPSAPHVEPRGINPALFRPTPPALGPANFPTTEQVRSELSGIFQRAYALDGRGRLNIINQSEADALQRRLDELRDIAMRDPRAAEAYDRPEITRYAYLTLPSFDAEEKGLLYRLSQGFIPATEVVRQLDQDEVDFVVDYRGRGNPFQDPFYTDHRALAFAVREIVPETTFAQAATASALTIADGTSLLNRYDGERQARTRLRQAPINDLREVSRFLSENFDQLETALWSDPPNPRMPALLQEIRPLLRRRSASDTRITALQVVTYASFVMTVGGTNSLERDLFETCRSQFRQTDEQTCRLRAGFQLASESPDQFDNARLRHQLSEHLALYYARYLGLTPAERVSQQDLLLEAELGQALIGGEFGPPFTPDQIRPILEDVRRQTGLTHIPARRRSPVSWNEISAIRAEPIEVRVDDLPRDLQAMAQRVTVRIPRAGNATFWEGTLWDYLRENVDTVVLTRQAPYLSDDIGEPEGTANRLFRTVILDIDGIYRAGQAQTDKHPFEILSTLAHEAYHNDCFHNLVPADPRLARATTLNERNAHLFETQVLRQILAARFADAQPFIEQVVQANGNGTGLGEEVLLPLRQLDSEASLLIGLATSHRLTGLSANVPLDYSLGDENLWTTIFPHVPVTSLDRYPTAFTAEYLRMRHITQERFAQENEEAIMSSLGLSSGSPSRDRARRGRSGTSTAGSR